ncbi:MAG: YihY/virulence factor BrkB family protein [Acetobacteraceae bacterium]
MLDGQGPTPPGQTEPHAPPLPARRHLWAVLKQLANAMVSDRVSLSVAGLAFYATFALFPAITMLIFLYGLVFDPHAVEAQLSNIRTLVPPPAYSLINQRVHALVSNRGNTLQLGLIISALVAYWSASTGTKSLLSALNIAYGEKERRGIIRFQLTGFGMTLAVILTMIVGIAIMVGLPHLIGFFGLSHHQKALLRLGGGLGLVIFIFGALLLIYRFGPSRGPGTRHILLPGGILATVGWIAGSALFSVYVGHIANYNVTYGPLAAVIGIMMWFYVSAFMVLLGAELNAALERARDPRQVLDR